MTNKEHNITLGRQKRDLKIPFQESLDAPNRTTLKTGVPCFQPLQNYNHMIFTKFCGPNPPPQNLHDIQGNITKDTIAILLDKTYQVHK